MPPALNVMTNVGFEAGFTWRGHSCPRAFFQGRAESRLRRNERSSRRFHALSREWESRAGTPARATRVTDFRARPLPGAFVLRPESV